MLDTAAQNLLSSDDLTARRAAFSHLCRTSVVPRMGLLRQFSTLPNGVNFLVGTRADLREIKGNIQFSLALAAYLKELLSSWFDFGLLNY